MALSNLTDIANYALNSINAGSIMSIDSNDRAAGICKKYIDLAFIQTLSEGEYTSTLRRATLSKRDDMTRPDYTYCYYLPEDYVKALALETGAEFEIEAGALFTNDYEARLLYVARLQNLAQYQPFILDCVALNLASMICVELKGDSNLSAQMIAQLRLMVRRAKGHDRSERNGRKGRPATWSSWNSATEEW